MGALTLAVLFAIGLAVAVGFVAGRIVRNDAEDATVTAEWTEYQVNAAYEPKHAAKTDDATTEFRLAPALRTDAERVTAPACRDVIEAGGES